MTDERMGDDLWDALARLPRGAGVVFRHHATEPARRRRLLRRVEKVATARGLLLVVAGQGSHGRHGAHGANARRPRNGVLTRPAHNRGEARRAARGGAELIFASPVFATRSHPGARVLGPVRLGLMIRGVGVPVIALGGMDADRFRQLRGLGLHGWAAIDAWLPDRQKRKAVPT